jgi:hypothetical protein
MNDEELYNRLTQLQYEIEELKTAIEQRNMVYQPQEPTVAERFIMFLAATGQLTQGGN